MRKIFFVLLTLISAINLCAQSVSTEARSLVIKTNDGQITRFNLADIEELTFDNSPADVSTVLSLVNLSPEFISVSGLEENQTLNAGEQAVLTLTAGPILSGGFQDYHFEHIHIHVNDQVIVPAVPDGYTPSDEIKVAFGVPSGDCDIVVCYSIQQQMTESGYTMTLEENQHVRLFGVSPDCLYKYFDAYLLADEAYVITDAEFKIGDNDWASVNGTVGCSLTPDYDIPNLYHICIRPDYQNVTGNVVLRVSGEQHHRYNITWLNADSQYLDLEKSILPTQAIDGDRVTAELYVNEDYYLNGASASDGTTVETLYNAYVQFTMPSSDVAITLDILKKIPVSYVESEHVIEAKIYDAPDIYYGRETSLGIPGENVYIIATAENGYKPMTATTDDGQTFNFTHYGLNMYLCPVTISKDATSMSVSITCDDAWTVSSKQDVSFDNGALYAEGENVSFAIKVPDGKKIETVTASTLSGKSIDLTIDFPYGSFIMPAEDVDITVTYADLPVGNTVSVIAYYDQDQYSVRSSTNYDWDFAEGFNIDRGVTFYLSVYDDYGENFYVGVKIGDTVDIYPATEDEESGEFTFGKALIANGDVTIKVGPSESSVKF